MATKSYMTTPQPKDTTLVKKMEYIFDEIADTREEEPHYLFANSKNEQTIIFYSSAKGYYIVDHNDIFIQENISFIMRQYSEIVDSDGETKVVTNNRSVKSWFDRRKSGDIPKLIKLYKEELVFHGLIKKPEEFQRFSFYDRKEKYILMNLKNSAIKIDLVTKETHEIDFDHSHNFLSKLDIEYEPKVCNKLWEETIQDIIPDKNSRELLRNWCAYSLINGYFNWNVSILLYGPKANNGKNTFMGAWGSLFQNVVSTNLKRISKQFGLKQLFEADFIIADESDAKFTDTNQLKKLIEGDKLTIEGKGQNEFTAMIDAKMIIATNKLAHELISDNGIMRRIEVIITPNSFYDYDEGDLKDDSNLKFDLLNIKSTIFNWGMAAIFNVVENVDEFKKGVRERTKRIYMDNETPFGNFFAEFGIIDPEGSLEGECNLDDLVYYYEEYSKKYQTEAVSTRRMSKFIREEFPHTIKKHGRSKRFKKKFTTIYVGISLNERLLLNKLNIKDVLLPDIERFDFLSWGENEDTKTHKNPN